MEKLASHFNKILIHEDSWESEVAHRARNFFACHKIVRVREKPSSPFSGTLSADDFTQSKHQLYIGRHEGQFFKRCPGFKPGLTCCNYFVLNLGVQCNMDCSYCYLQSYINSPYLTIYSNIDDALNELHQMASEKNNASLPFRVGTGETIDSLSLDELTLYSKKLISFFKSFPQWRLEFKTKSDAVQQFLGEEHANNVIVSWSINPQYIVSKEEHRTASTEARLQAAEMCRDNGFIIAFHMDPMIWHDNWKETYGELVDDIATRFSPEEMPPISIGALRHQPEQRHIMRERFGMNSLVTQAEMFLGRDGKSRYDQVVRQEMFKFVMERFQTHNPKWQVSLCMEQIESWWATKNKNPRQIEELDDFFRPLPRLKRS